MLLKSKYGLENKGSVACEVKRDLYIENMEKATDLCDPTLSPMFLFPQKSRVLEYV